MRVLHFIPDLEVVSSSNLMNYKLALLKDMAESTDVHVLTCNAGNVSLGRAVVYGCSSVGTFVKRGKKRIVKVLDKLKPEVVHIHASWNYTAYCLFDCCLRRKIPTVITLDRSLEPWHVLHHYWLCKLPKLVLFQRRMLKDAVALHAVCFQEKSSLQRFAWHPRLKQKHCINDRVVEIDAYNVANGTDLKDMVRGLLRLYRKVADSSPFPQMTEEERLVEDKLMMLGVNASRLNMGQISGEVVSQMRSFDEKSWRKVLLHSADEGILDYVKSGMVKVGIQPSINPYSIERFSLRKDDNDTRSKVARNSKLLSLKKDGALSGFELELCECLVSVILMVRRSCVHRSDFVKLYEMLRFNEYDEDFVEEKINKLGLGGEAASLFQIMKERYGLGEGFMFAEPSDGRETEKLRLKLSKSDIQ